MRSAAKLIACLACAAGAVIASGMGKGFARGGAAEIWYTIMSICLLGMALIYAAWWVVELAEELAKGNIPHIKSGHCIMINVPALLRQIGVTEP